MRLGLAARTGLEAWLDGRSAEDRPAETVARRLIVLAAPMGNELSGVANSPTTFSSGSLMEKFCLGFWSTFVDWKRPTVDQGRPQELDHQK